jgi:cytochrome b561
LKGETMSDTALRGGLTTYPAQIRFLHWTMAIGFVAVWLTGILTVNLEGLGSELWDDRQGQVRDLHKSLALTLVVLAIIRLFAKWLLPSPPLPSSMALREQHFAQAGHTALYIFIFLTAATGLAIADLQGYGNAYFGIDLPALYPVKETVAGWTVNPWSYVLHALLAYSLLLFVCGHVAAVYMHRRQNVDLSSRMVGDRPTARVWINRATVVLAFVVALVAVGALRGHLTFGPAEVPRDYSNTT